MLLSPTLTCTLTRRRGSYSMLPPAATCATSAPSVAGSMAALTIVDLRLLAGGWTENFGMNFLTMAWRWRLENSCGFSQLQAAPTPDTPCPAVMPPSACHVLVPCACGQPQLALSRLSGDGCIGQVPPSSVLPRRVSQALG